MTENTESRALRIADRIDQAVILNPFQLARVIAILREELTERYPSVTDDEYAAAGRRAKRAVEEARRASYPSVTDEP